jgi:hypothetical protein
MSKSTGDRIILIALAAVVLAMAGVIVWEVMRSRPQPAPNVTTGAPAESKPAEQPKPEKPAEKPAEAPSWERFNG